MVDTRVVISYNSYKNRRGDYRFFCIKWMGKEMIYRKIK